MCWAGLADWGVETQKPAFAEDSSSSLPRISRAFCSVRAGVPVQRFENSEVFPRRNGWFDWSKSHVVEHNMCNRSSEPQQPDYLVYLYL